MRKRKREGGFKKNFTFIERQLIVTINRELKLSYKATKKTNIQALLNIRTIKRQRKTEYTVKD